MLRCLLVASYEEPPRSFIKPPLGLMWLRKVAEAANLAVTIEIVDPQLVTAKYAKEKIENDWDIIGFYTTYPTLLNSINLMIHAWLTHNDRHPRRPLLIGGGPGVMFGDIFSITPLDVIVIGEGEKLWVELIRRIISSGLRPPISSANLHILANLPGNYRIRYTRAEDSNVEIFSHKAPVIETTLSAEDLDRLIEPLPWEFQLHIPYVEWTRAKLHHTYGFPIYATRGCSRPGCMFCSSFKSVSSRGGTRAPTVQALLNVFRLACEEPLKARSFILEDDTFVWNRQWVIDLCNLVERAKSVGELPSDVTFVVKSRVDQFDENLIRHMTRTGFTQINVGIESGSPTTLRKTAKVADPYAYLKNAGNIVQYISKYGLRVHAYMLFFTPESELDDLVMTIDLATELISRGAEISTYETVLALPGSPYEQVWQRGRIVVQTDRVDNPMLSTVAHALPDAHSFYHPSFGPLPTQVELPKYLLPSDPVMQEILLTAQEAFPENWARFKQRFGWDSSTSARDGYVRIWTYLSVLGTMQTSASIADRLDRIRVPLQRTLAYLEPGPGQIPENQSCTNYELFHG